jgi:L,D-peptidoglycan transpeptidase YkuD (ErfK/YbiS/YcfS/YnhG family)
LLENRQEEWLFPMVLQRPARPEKPRGKLVVRAISAAAKRGILQFGSLRLPCALGRSGVKALKREGDGATPRGRYGLRYVLYKPEGLSRPETRLARCALRVDDGWCDKPSDRNYNRRVKLPYPQSAERLWRADGLYDVVVVLGYNDVPRVRNRGSAVFMHVARRGFKPTEGCIALRKSDLHRLLRVVPRDCEVIIEV